MSNVDVPAGVTAALDEWRTALGAAHVSDDAATTARSSTATFTTTARVTAVLRPANRDEVQQCVRIANRHKVALYPFSSGKNWGYGSRAPVGDGALLDLGRLNRILELNEDLAYATIEPGVTQRQLYDLLRSKGSTLWMDATGSSPDCSIIGNTIDRGFGHTPYGDHCDYVCGFEVVLPNGDLIETGFARFPHSRAGAIGRWGTGPSLDGLFSQSGLGIVTRMTIWLMPAPEHFEAFVFQAAGPIEPLIEALRPLRMNGTLRSVMHIGNDYKVISGMGQYPWDVTGGKTPLSGDAMVRLRKQLRIADWSGSGGLYGTRAEVRDARKRVRRALAGKVTRLQFVDDSTVALLRRVEQPYRWLTGRGDLRHALKMLPGLLDLMRGIPTDEFLTSMYWRKKTAPPASAVDPDRDRCGLLWFSPVAPNTGADVAKVTQISTALVLEHGFEPMISVSLMSARMTVSTIAITYDREVPGEDERAMACYLKLGEALGHAGYPPYRVNVAAMGIVAPQGPYQKVVRALKSAVDPNHILAPGRYE